MPANPVAKPRWFDFRQCQLSFNGVPLGDYGAGGIKFAYVTEEVKASELSLDKIVHVSANVDPRMRATLSFKRVCPAVYMLRDLAARMEQVEFNGGGLQVLRFSFMESLAPGVNGNGDFVMEPNAYFFSVPGSEFMDTEGDLEFVIELPSGRFLYQPGTNFLNTGVTTIPLL